MGTCYCCNRKVTNSAYHSQDPKPDLNLANARYSISNSPLQPSYHTEPSTNIVSDQELDSPQSQSPDAPNSPIELKQNTLSITPEEYPHIPIRQRLVIEYWHRTLVSNGSSISIDDVIAVMLEFAEYVGILKFNQECPELTFKYKNTLAIKSTRGHRKCIIPHTQPIENGAICWRIKMKNSRKRWFFWGMSAKIKTSIQSMDSKEYYTNWNRDIIGVSSGHHYNQCHIQKIGAVVDNENFDPTSREKFQMDIYLDVDKRMLKMGIVGDILSDNGECIWNGIIGDCQLVPHFCFNSSQGQELQIASIPLAWYGKCVEIDWTKYDDVIMDQIWKEFDDDLIE